VIGGETAADCPQAGGEHDERGNREQQPAFGQQLQILVVRVVEVRLVRRRLVDDHRPFVRAGADAGPPEISNHRQRRPPNLQTAAHALIHRVRNSRRDG
jgi:hypothetical protein